MKKCARCREWKFEDDFNWKNESQGKRQSVCRSCQVGDRKEWYDAHADSVKEKTASNRRNDIEEAQRYIYEFLSNAKCADCGEYDFTVLTFHHVRGNKRMDVSQMAAHGYSISAIQAEISKCVVLCSNCHMRRENESRSGGRFRRFWPKMPWED